MHLRQRKPQLYNAISLLGIRTRGSTFDPREVALRSRKRIETRYHGRTWLVLQFSLSVSDSLPYQDRYAELWAHVKHCVLT